MMARTHLTILIVIIALAAPARSALAGATSGKLMPPVKFKAPVGTVLEYSTKCSSTEVNGWHWDEDAEELQRQFVIPAKGDTRWQLVVVSRDKSGNTDLAMPIVLEQTITREDIRKALEAQGLLGKGADSSDTQRKPTLVVVSGYVKAFDPTKDPIPDVKQTQSGILTPKLDARGGVLDDPSDVMSATNLSFVYDTGLLYPGVTIVPYPAGAKHVGDTWTRRPTFREQGRIRSYRGSLGSIDAKLLGVETIGGHRCAKVSYTLSSSKGSDLELTRSVQTVWVDQDGGYIVRADLDVDFHYSTSPDMPQSMRSTTTLVGISRLTPEQLKLAVAWQGDIRSALKQFELCAVDQSLVPDLTRAQRFARIRELLAKADANSPRDEWKQGIKGLSDLTSQAEKRMKDYE